VGRAVVRRRGGVPRHHVRRLAAAKLVQGADQEELNSRSDCHGRRRLFRRQQKINDSLFPIFSLTFFYHRRKFCR
jgi:hypothetical protein